MTGANIMGIRRCCWKRSSTPHDSMEPAIARQTGSILEKPPDEAGWIDTTEPKSFRKRFLSFRCVEMFNRLYAPAIHRLFRLPIRTDAVNNYEKTYTNHLLVESIQTPKGPRQRIICSLGSLEPGPAEEWLGLAHKLQSALQGQESLPESSEQIQEWVEKARSKKRGTTPPEEDRSELTVTVQADRIEIEQAREAGPVHVGHQLWSQLGMNSILQEVGLSQRACTLTEVMTLNRLICPRSEHAMPDWIRRTALGDILKEDFSQLQDEALYRNLDRLHPNREHIERELANKEKTMFNLDDTVYLYDLSSTYFEGQAQANPQAKRGYSRDKRPDCKQVVVGLVLDRDGFPKAHEIFDGNMQDRRSLDKMLDALEKRTDKRAGATVIVDRGMAFDENLEQIRKRGLHYLVAGLQPERNQWLDELENDDAGNKCTGHPRRAIRFRKNHAWKSSASRRTAWFTFSAAAKGVNKSTEPFEKRRKRN